MVACPAIAQSMPALQALDAVQNNTVERCARV
jgi:hypothetical protein